MDCKISSSFSYVKYYIFFLERTKIKLPDEADCLFLMNDEETIYPCSEYSKSSHFHFLHKLCYFMDVCPMLYTFLSEIINEIPKKDIDVKNKEGWTPLMIVCRKSYDAVKLLLEHGADVNATLYTSLHSPLLIISQCMFEMKYKTFELFILYGANIHHKNSDNDTALTFLLKCEDMILIKKIIDLGIDIHHKNSDNNNYLIIFCSFIKKENPIPFIRFLLEKGLDINEKNNRGNTALMYAVSNPNEKYGDQIVTFLLENGANTNIYNKVGKNALYESLIGLEEENEHIVNILCEYGSNVNVIVNNKFKCYYAFISSHNFQYEFFFKIAILLLNHGYDGKQLLLECEKIQNRIPQIWIDNVRSFIDSFNGFYLH